MRRKFIDTFVISFEITLYLLDIFAFTVLSMAGFLLVFESSMVRDWAKSLLLSHSWALSLFFLSSIVYRVVKERHFYIADFERIDVGCEAVLFLIALIITVVLLVFYSVFQVSIDKVGLTLWVSCATMALQLFIYPLIERLK